MSKTNSFEAVILNLIARHTIPTGLTGDFSSALALFKVAPTDSSDGTECDYTGYERQFLGSSFFGSVATGGNITSTANISFPTNAGSAQSVVAVGIWYDYVPVGTPGDLPNLAYYQTITPVSIGSGEVPRFTAGNVVITED